MVMPLLIATAGNTVDNRPAELLAGFLSGHRGLFVLTWAGVITDSEVSSYRDREGESQAASHSA